MFLMRFLRRWIDPERLIPTKTWWIIGILAALTGLLFGALMLLTNLGERSIRERVILRDRFVVTKALGDELDHLGAEVRKYEALLQEFVGTGDTTELKALEGSRKMLLETEYKVTLLAISENRPGISVMNALIDSVFSEGARVISLRSRYSMETARMQLSRGRIPALYHKIRLLANHMFRVQVDSMQNKIDANATLEGGPLRGTLIGLSSLAGVLFVLLILVMARTARRVMKDRRAYIQLLEEQQKATAFTQNLINTLPIGYHSIDAQGLIIEMNQTELDWLGHTREEVVGKKHITELFYSENMRTRFSETMGAFMQEGCIRNMEVSLLGKNGVVIPALCNAKAVYDVQGNFSHSLSTIYNFTERKKLEDALVEARQEAEKAQQIKQLFMANMSHEIRTPLNAIIGFASVLGRSKLPPDLVEYVQCIQTSGANLLSIVNDILDFEKIQSGMLRIDQVEFDLQGLLHSVVTMVRPGAAEKRLSVHLNAASNLPHLLLGDPMRLTQIIINLLGNAIKFTESGGYVILRIFTVHDVQGSDAVRICFEVEDNGIGIPASEHARIFERFIQADNDTIRRYGGTGLGLALVKMLVELQQGTITLKSEVGKGSTFSIEIPYQVSQRTELAIDAHMAPNGTAPDFKGHRVLLVEDNPMNRRIAELQLVELGLDITQASGGKEAIELLRTNPEAFSMVLMDIQMPEMDGYITTRIIRNKLGMNQIPIIAITAHVLAGEREKVIACGMNDYLAKPVRYFELINILQRYLPMQAYLQACS